MKKTILTATLTLASFAATAAKPGSLDAAKDAAKQLMSLICGVSVEEMATRGVVFKDGIASVATQAQGTECTMMLLPNQGLNAYGWEVKQYECHAGSRDSKEGSVASGVSH